MNLRPLSYVAAGLATLALAACAPTPEQTAKVDESAQASGDKPKSLTIVMIGKSDNNPVFPSARVGAERAAQELSTKTGVDIKIDWRTPPAEDGTVQAQRIADAVNQGAGAILISCSDAAKVTAAINDAVDKGVPVMTFDSDAPDSKRFAFYGVNDMETGKRVMDELVAVTGGTANVAILAGNQNAPNLQKRVEGVKEASKAHPGIKIVDTYYHVETPQDAAAKVREVMQARPEVNAWAMVGGWPLFVPSLLDLDPAKVKIVAVDALPLQLPYVEKGIAPILLAQPTYEWGYTSVGIIVDKVIDKKEVQEINDMQLEKVTKENLNAWAKKLQDWGFKDIDPKYLQ